MNTTAFVIAETSNAKSRSERKLPIPLPNVHDANFNRVPPKCEHSATVNRTGGL